MKVWMSIMGMILAQICINNMIMYKIVYFSLDKIDYLIFVKIVYIFCWENILKIKWDMKFIERINFNHAEFTYHM